MLHNNRMDDLRSPPAPSLVDEIDAFLARHSMTPTRFGGLFLNDRMFVGRLRRGRDPKESMLRRVRGKMAEYDENAADISNIPAKSGGGVAQLCQDQGGDAP